MLSRGEGPRSENVCARGMLRDRGLHPSDPVPCRNDLGTAAQRYFYQTGHAVEVGVHQGRLSKIFTSRWNGYDMIDPWRGTAFGYTATDQQKCTARCNQGKGGTNDDTDWIPFWKHIRSTGQCSEACNSNTSANVVDVPNMRIAVPVLAAGDRRWPPVFRPSLTCRLAGCSRRVCCLSACMRARCRAHVSCAARPLTSGYIVTCVWSRVYDVRVRGGARAPPHIRFIR